MVKNIIKLAMYAVLIVSCSATYKALSMFTRIPKEAVKAAGKFPKKPPASQQKPTMAPGKSLPVEHQQSKPPATSQSKSFVKPGKNIPSGPGTSILLQPKPHFQPTPESSITFVKPPQATVNSSPFSEGNALLEAVKATTKVDISNPNYEKQTEENLLKAINDLQDQGFTVFLVPKNAASFLGENQLIPQEQGQWLTQEIFGKAYAASILLDTGNIIVLARSRSKNGKLYGINAPTTGMKNYLYDFHLPTETKIQSLTNNEQTQQALSSGLDSAQQRTQQLAETIHQQEQEKVLSEPIVPEEKPEIKAEAKEEPKLEAVEPITAIPIPPKQPIQPSADLSSQKEIKDITKLPESPADIIESHKEAEDRAKELAEEKRFQEAEKARLEKELPEIVAAEYETFEKELAQDEAVETQIAKLTEKLALTNQKIDATKQQHQNELKEIAQENETINADLDQQLIEFEKEQKQELDQIKANARRMPVFSKLDIEEQNKLLERLASNYQEKIAKDLAKKKQALTAEKNQRIQALEEAHLLKLKKREAKQQQLEQKQKFFQKKIQEQKTLSLEIAEGTKTLADMINKSQVNELLLAQIKQKATDAQKQFNLEKEQIETESNQKLQAEEKQLQQKQALLETEKAEYVKNLKQKLADETTRIQKAEQDLEEAVQNKKNEIDELKKAAQVKSAEKDISNEREIEELQQQLQNLEDLHTTSKELRKEQENQIAQAQAKIKELEQQELQAKEDRAKEAKEAAAKAAKEAQENVLKLRKEVADKKAELERANQEANQTKNNLKKAGENVVQAEEQQKSLEKLVPELEQQIAQEKKQLSEEEQKKLLLEQEENEKKLKAEQVRLEQEVAEKEELRLKAEKDEQEALANKKAAQEAAAKAAKDLDDAIKEQQEKLLKEKEEEKKRDEEDKRKKAEEEKLNIELPGGGDNQLPQDEEKEQEQIQKPEELPFPQPSEEQPEQKPSITKLQPPYEPHIEISPVLSEKIHPAVLSEKISKVGMQQPTEPSFQLPATLTQEPVFPSGHVPKTSIPQSIIMPSLQVPPVTTQEPIFPSEQVPKTSIPQSITMPSLQIPPVTTQEPVFLSGQTPKTGGEQPSPISIPAVEIKEPMVEQALPESKPIKKPKPSVPEQAVAEPIEPSEPHIKPLEPTTPEETRGSSGPVDMTPIVPRPVEWSPYPELEHKIHIPNLQRDRSIPATTPPHSYQEMISSGSSESFTEQPQTYLPIVKTPSAQVTPKKKKLSAKALILLERLFLKKESDRIRPEITKNKGIGAWLRGLSLLQQQHAKSHKKPRPEKKETRTPTKVTANKPNRIVSFIQSITTAIEETVTAVIDTMSSYINAFKNLF